LAGIPVHVITVNDYLVERDAQWMRPVYDALGLSVGIIVEGMDHEARRAAYACDVTYCTNKQLVFDYLRDRLTMGEGTESLRLRLESLYTDQPRSSKLLLRGLCFAIVDEADSVLVDEARTPLIISRTPENDDQEQLYRQALRLGHELELRTDFDVRRRDREVELTEHGKDRLGVLAAALGSVWRGTRYREELVRQALTALYLFERDKQYLIRDGKVQIIDEYTGRVMPDRSWEQGLHQMIEAKEGCEITVPAVPIARISYQRFFRRYLRLAGMTGTAREIAGELRSVYGLNVVTIPTHRPLRRRRLPSRIFGSGPAKWQAVVERIRGLRAQDRPVLVGTRSVADSETLSQLLHDGGVPHQVLNARQDEHEAHVIAEAGQAGRITVATNMAGRGTDIVLGPGVASTGGLHVIATERHEAGRIDRQLFGRCARQGDPGSIEFILAVDDQLMREFYPKAFVALLARRRPGLIQRRLGPSLAALPQHAAEHRHARIRRALLKADAQLGDLLAFSGRSE
jgi:preprotein translocase subunit SecA